MQDCNDLAKWPLQKIAANAAAARPDLVIHVGDYHYREEACPADAQALCGGTPSGDNWLTWEADFFKPAAQLLAAAPWAFTRGNHEDCERAFRGWFYYLDPRPMSDGCTAYSDIYVVRMGGLDLVMFDSSAITDDVVKPEEVERYAAQLRSVQVDKAWLVDHHPFWGLKPVGDGKPPVAISQSLQQAWSKAAPKGIDLVISGHTHVFELLSFGGGRPTQIVAGDGGTQLALPLPKTLVGIEIQGATVMGSEGLVEFGYSLLERVSGSPNAWSLNLYSQKGSAIASCSMRGREASCPASAGR